MTKKWEIPYRPHEGDPDCYNLSTQLFINKFLKIIIYIFCNFYAIYLHIL